MTPYNLEILLHHHCSHDEYPYRGAPGYLPEIEDFILKKVLVETSGHYETTDLGKAWIKEILSVDIPEVQYIGSKGKIYF